LGESVSQVNQNYLNLNGILSNDIEWCFAWIDPRVESKAIWSDVQSVIIFQVNSLLKY
jgi:hypothetical protein